jgi:hypothetical protein
MREYLGIASLSRELFRQANESLLFEKSFKETKSYLYFTLCNVSPQKKNLYNNGLFSGIISLQKRDFDSEKLEKFVDGVSQYLSVLGSGLNFSFRVKPRRIGRKLWEFKHLR